MDLARQRMADIETPQHGRTREHRGGYGLTDIGDYMRRPRRLSDLCLPRFDGPGMEQPRRTSYTVRRWVRLCGLADQPCLQHLFAERTTSARQLGACKERSGHGWLDLAMIPHETFGAQRLTS